MDRAVAEMVVAAARLATAGKYAIEYMGKSPLGYNRTFGQPIERLVLIDERIPPPAKGDQYFKTIEKWRHTSKRRPYKRLKKPVLDEVIPGIESDYAAAFIDFEINTKSKWSYIHYINTRRDLSGRNYMTVLMDEFYKYASKKGVRSINWGKMMHPKVSRLLKKMQKRYPKISSSGGKNFDPKTEIDKPLDLSDPRTSDDPFQPRQGPRIVSMSSAADVWAQGGAEWFAEAFFKKYKSLNRLMNKTVKGVVGESKQRGSASATYDATKKVIRLFPKFFEQREKYGEEFAAHVFAHELGHSIESNVSWYEDAQAAGMDLWDTANLPFGQPNMDEAFAECFAILSVRSDPGDAKRLAAKWPQWETLVRDTAAKVGVKL